MKLSVVLAFILFGIPAIYCFGLGLDLILHLKGIRESKNEKIKEKCSSKDGKKRVKRDIIICYFIFITFAYILVDGVVHS